MSAPVSAIKELHIEVHKGAVVYSHDKGERFLNKDAVTIHIGWIKETPSHSDTISHKQICALSDNLVLGQSS
jgi:hypothetical protein